MPQDGAGNYYYPPGTPGIPDQTIESEKYNTFLDDLVVNDLNFPRPIHRGGTGANSPPTARNNLKAEACDQLVTNYDDHVFYPGSFRSAAAASGAPNGHAFAGICYLNEPLTYPPENKNFILEVRDEGSTDIPGFLYVRERKAGAWAGPWKLSGGNTIEGDVVINDGDIDINNGNLNVHNGDIYLISPVGDSNEIHGQHTTGAPATAKDRWVLVLGDNTPEDGVPPNDGSNYLLKRYDDAGVLIDTVMSFNRATGEGSFTKTPTAPTMASGDSSLHVATTQYVRDALILAAATPSVMRTRLLANTTRYVSTPAQTPPGNDTTGDGTAAKPWATLHFMANFIATNIDLNGFDITVNCKGAFAATGNTLRLPPLVRGNGVVHLVGDVNGVTPPTTAVGSCSITNTLNDAIVAGEGSSGWKISGFKVTSGNFGITAIDGGVITLGDYNDFAGGQAHIAAINNGAIKMDGARYFMNAGSGGCHMLIKSSGSVSAVNAIVTIPTGGLTMDEFVHAQSGGVLYAAGFIHGTNEHLGKKFTVTTAGGIDFNGTGEYALPGTISGTTTAPGWIIL